MKTYIVHVRRTCAMNVNTMIRHTVVYMYHSVNTV